LWRRGEELADTSAGERRILRLLLVNQLIDDELLKLQIKVSMSKEVAVAEERVEKAMELERDRYPFPEVYPVLAKRAGWQGEDERKMRVAARIQRAEHLERLVGATVTEEEVREWFDRHASELDGGFEANREAIRDALLVGRRDQAWKAFRLGMLRPRAKGKIDLFEDVLFGEED
jgi:hypothetical protein